MEGITYYDIKKPPFEIFGLYEPLADEECYIRVPREVAKATSDRVAERNLFTAGGRVRFKTDSDVIVIKALGDHGLTFHQTPVSRHGFDVYIDRPRGSEYMGMTTPAVFCPENFEAVINLGGGEKELTVNMPLFGQVKSLEIGLREGASVSAHSPYKHTTPIVYYGSSITQGAGASRPGRSYEAIISRKYDLNYINLGYSGSCLAEDAIVEYISGLEMSAFVSDYDHNAPTVEHLRDTHHRMYEKIREKHPDIPYFMITKPDFRYNKDNYDRRAVIMESYLKAYMSGDRNVYFIDGSVFFSGAELSDLTVDRCHPNDEGYSRMAACIGDVIAKVMKL